MHNSFELLYALKKLGYLKRTPDPLWWPHSGTLEVVVGALLTQQSRWERVEQSLENLRDHHLLSLIALSPADINQLSYLIKPSGFYNIKAHRLIELSKNLEVMDIPLNHMNMYYKYENLTLRELAGHMVAVREADLKYPIILDEDGEIMDGRHRLIKAIIENKKTIKAVRFKENPEPCKVED